MPRKKKVIIEEKKTTLEEVVEPKVIVKGTEKATEKVAKKTVKKAIKKETVKIEEEKETTEKPKITLKPAVYFAVGRRKCAIARVRLYTGLPKEENKILINDKQIEEFFTSELAKKAYIEPFRTTNTIGKFKVTVRVVGSGQISQLSACILGFARAIEQVDKPKFRPILKKRGLLTRDSRIRERRKVGTGGKARRQKQSPKR